MEKKYRERFKRIITYLETMDEREFDFDWIIKSDEAQQQTQEKHLCGTVGCVIGHMPNIFPKEFGYESLFASSFGTYNLKSRTMEFLNLTYVECMGLFFPESQTPIGLPMLTALATPKEVARNMRLYIDWFKYGPLSSDFLAFHWLMFGGAKQLIGVFG